MNVIPENAALLTCQITGITKAVTVVWKNHAEDNLKIKQGYTVDEGVLSGDKQESKLTITATGISGQQEIETFSCSVKSGEFAANSPEITKSVKVTKLSHGTHPESCNTITLLT